jgi:hypothetical protein
MDLNKTSAHVRRSLDAFSLDQTEKHSSPIQTLDFSIYHEVFYSAYFTQNNSSQQPQTLPSKEAKGF